MPSFLERHNPNLYLPDRNMQHAICCTAQGSFSHPAQWCWKNYVDVNIHTDCYVLPFPSADQVIGQAIASTEHRRHENYLEEHFVLWALGVEIIGCKLNKETMDERYE